MMYEYTAKEIRIKWAEAMRLIARGHTITITHYGNPIVILTKPEDK